MSLFVRLREKTQGQPSIKFNWVEPVDSRAGGHLFQYVRIGSLSPMQCDEWEAERWRQREQKKTRNTKLSKERKRDFKVCLNKQLAWWCTVTDFQVVFTLPWRTNTVKAWEKGLVQIHLIQSLIAKITFYTVSTTMALSIHLYTFLSKVHNSQPPVAAVHIYFLCLQYLHTVSKHPTYASKLNIF